MMDGWYGNGWGVGAWVAMAVLMLIFWGRGDRCRSDPGSAYPSG